MTSKQIEIIEIDRKYECYRVQSPPREKILLGSIADRGVDEAVLGVCCKNSGKYILLDGFKRLRCAIKLGHRQIALTSIGEDEADCIIYLIRMSNVKGLTMLEQAKLVDELNRIFGLSVAEIASRLQRSKSWVNVRLQVLGEMSPVVVDAIISGKFPLYSYVYTLRPLRRLRGSESKKEVDKFVTNISGKNLSVRDIELLSEGYFRGGAKLKQEIENGNIGWCLGEMKQRADAKSSLPSSFNETEKRTIRDLEFLSQLLGRLPLRLTHRDLKSAEFFAESVVIVGGLVSLWPEFINNLRNFYDRCGVRASDNKVKQPGSECAEHGQGIEYQQEHDSKNN